MICSVGLVSLVGLAGVCRESDGTDMHVVVVLASHPWLNEQGFVESWMAERCTRLEYRLYVPGRTDRGL